MIIIYYYNDRNYYYHINSYDYFQKNYDYGCDGYYLYYIYHVIIITNLCYNNNSVIINHNSK